MSNARIQWATEQNGGDFEFDVELETPKRLKLGQSLCEDFSRC